MRWFTSSRPGCLEVNETVTRGEIIVIIFLGLVIIAKVSVEPTLRWPDRLSSDDSRRLQTSVGEDNFLAVSARVRREIGDQGRIQASNQVEIVGHGRSARQASVPQSVSQCPPFPSGEDLRRALTAGGVNNSAACAQFSAVTASQVSTLNLCVLARDVADLTSSLDMVYALLSPSEAQNSTVQNETLTNVSATLEELQDFTEVTCAELSMLNDSDSSSSGSGSSGGGSMPDITYLVYVKDQLSASATSLQDVVSADLMYDLDRIERELRDTSRLLASLSTVASYDEQLDFLADIAGVERPDMCVIAYPPCQDGAPVHLYAQDASICNTPRLLETIFYPRTYPQSAIGGPYLFYRIWHDQCVRAGNAERVASCFVQPTNASAANADGPEPTTTAAGAAATTQCAGVPVYSCPTPFQTTDDPEHWLPQFAAQEANLNDFVTNLRRPFHPCMFPCGQECRAEGYDEDVALALRAVQSVSVYISLLLTLAALVMAVVNRKNMFRYPNRLFLYLNVSFLLFIVSYLPAASVDVVPLLCHSDRTLRRDNFTDSALCVYTFVFNYGGGILLQTVTVLIAFSWLRLARSFKKVTLTRRDDTAQMLLEAGVLLTGLVFAAIGVGVLLAKDDGVDMIIQNGICTVASKHSFAAVEMPYTAASCLQAVFLAAGMYQLWTVRNTSRVTRREASAIHGGANRADESLSRIIKTLFLYILIMVLSGIGWILAVAAVRIAGIDPNTYFDSFAVFVCTLATCGADRCASQSIPTYNLVSDFVFAILLGVTGAVYSSWMFQRTIWQKAGVKRRMSLLSTMVGSLSTRLSLVSLRSGGGSAAARRSAASSASADNAVSSEWTIIGASSAGNLFPNGNSTAPNGNSRVPNGDSRVANGDSRVANGDSTASNGTAAPGGASLAENTPPWRDSDEDILNNTAPSSLAVSVVISSQMSQENIICSPRDNGPLYLESPVAEAPT